MLEISFLDVLLVAAGALAVVTVAVSGLIRQLPVSEPLVALLVGVLLGPQVVGALDAEPLTVESAHLHDASRLLLALSVVAVALRYPREAVLRRWRPVALLLVVVMPLMAVTTAAVAATVLGVGLGVAALLGAALAPTDPVLASSVVTGRPAEKTLPGRDREVLSLESGANDGLAFPLVLAALAVAAPLGAGAATGEAVYAVLGAVVLGGGLGWLGARALAYAESRREAERTPTLLFTVFLALAVLGASGLFRLDGVLAAFAAGIAFNLAGKGDERARDAGLNESVNRMAALPFFVYLGAVLPWAEWAALGWPGVALAVGVLLLRRLPWLLLLARPLGLRRPDAVYLGWFGPIGVSAIFYLTLVAERGAATPELLAAGSLVVTASLVAHGITSSPGVALYRRRVQERATAGD
ncbi:cation:proton antiporter domain-containing protein [Pseudonocardia nigra]|uniref:cation:proton antiporter domain-containing protein n=1 Tax=Pseudonocardia nigra TaxID=1921578 RepID=UPI001C5FC2D8|nr:cation:proton antiporter [Pseudonocardia nigra]